LFRVDYADLDKCPKCGYDRYKRKKDGGDDNNVDDENEPSEIRCKKNKANRGALLTVKFRQLSHEFTFGVGMSFISYPLVLTPWYNKFVCACRFWSLVFMQDFNVETKTSGISSSSTT
jgi:hypothetical protein